jgi:hypothetical protein
MMISNVVRHGLLVLGLLGLAVGVLIPYACLFWMGCHINAGSQLGVGIAGAIGGSSLVFWRWRALRR